MHINLVSLFPEYFESPLRTALLGKARESGLVGFSCLNPRDKATDAHRTVDDRPYGGGPGMVMMLEPLAATLGELQTNGKLGRVLVLAASGRPFTQSMARDLAQEETLTLVCGRYEGIDARLAELFSVEAISVGCAVLNGGEAAAMMVVEACTRLIPGFMGKEASGDEESFSHGLLEYPHYTRPENYSGAGHVQGEEKISGHKIPEILRSGDHGKIARWRHERSLETTFANQPDMLDNAPLSPKDLAFLREKVQEEGRARLGRNLHVALVHYPVVLEKSGHPKKAGATSLTNLDIHDIARCSRTYGLGSFQVVTPLAEQQAILDTLLAHWTEGAGGRSNPDRAEALRLVRKAESIEAAVSDVTQLCGEIPFIVGTSAKFDEKSVEPLLTPKAVRHCLHKRPVLLLLGTGQGLAPEALNLCAEILRPLRWLDAYNHLPVRGALAILLDRLLGDIDSPME